MTTDSDSSTAPGKRWRNWLISSLIYSAIGVAALVSGASFFGRFHWILDLLSHFRAQYTGWFALWAIIAIATKGRDAAVLACLFTALNFVPLAHYYPPPFPSSPPGNHDLRVLTFNVLEDNEQKSEVLEWITSRNADVIVLQEFTSPWKSALKPLEDIYPHRHLNAGYWNYGIAIYSKFPLSEMKRERVSTSPASCLSANILIGKTPIKIFAIHPVSPDTETDFNFRNDYLKNLALEIEKVDIPVIVAGDYNASVFSSFLKTFQRKSGLQNAARGRGFHPTYNLYHPLFGIAIDHILHSPTLRSVDHYVGPQLGSDHNPVVADFILRR